MSNFKFRASTYHYPAGPVGYLEMDAQPEEKFPHPDGKPKKRNFKDDFDCKVKPEEIQVRDEQFLPYFGKVIKQDPVGDGEHKLHPIEVVIDESVLKEMAQHGRSRCGVGKKLQPLETAGFLAGKLKRDDFGRLWTHITKSVHNEPEEWGVPEEVTIPQTTQLLWGKEIKRLGLIKVGIWHTHPTYEPFQSDFRGWAGGRDVEATAHNCQHWWSLSMVVDPYGKEDYDPKREKKEGERQAVVGCYKMVAPGDEPDDFEDPLEMRWRSVALGIRKDGEGL